MIEKMLLLTHTDPFGESMIIFRDCYKKVSAQVMPQFSRGIQKPSFHKYPPKEDSLFQSN